MLPRKKGERKDETATAKHNFAPRTENLSSITFTEEEQALMDKGTKYVQPERLNQCQLESMAISCEQVIQTMEYDVRPEARTKIGKVLLDIKESLCRTNDRTQVMQRKVTDLQKKIRQNNLILTKADKGNTVVLMDKEEYTQKVESYIAANGYQELTKDPTQKYQEDLKAVLKQNNVPGNVRTLEMNPAAPKLKGLVKLHKADRPMRPLVNCIQSPCYKIAKFVATFLKENYQFAPRKSIRNNGELMEQLDQLEIKSNDKLISFDVSNMFGTIPKEELLALLKKNKYHGNPDGPKYADIVEEILSHNYCRFSSIARRGGLAMGSPLSPILAEIFMNDIENKILKGSKFQNSIKY